MEGIPVVAEAFNPSTDGMTSTSLEVIQHLPTPPMRSFFRGLNHLDSMLVRLGVRLYPTDTRQIRRLLKRGSAMALEVEGEGWADQGREIESLWEATLEAVDQCVREREQHAVARMVIAGAFKFYLQRRISIYDYLLKHPEVREVPIERPVFIAGFPRTGSTLMHRLLARATDARGYQHWELTMPVPPPRPGDANDFRIRKMGWGFKAIDYFVANHTQSIEAFHMSSATTIEEDTVLMWSMGLMNPLIFLHSDGALRERILSAEGRAGSYRYLRRCFQVLNAGYPRHVQTRFKSPFHTLYLEALYREFPDARVITLHREPKDVIESWISFLSRMAVPTFRPESFRMHEFSDPQIRFLEKSGEVMTALFDEPAKHRAPYHLALGFPAFVRDPVGTVEQVHDFFDLAPLTAHDKEAMQIFLTRKAAQKTLLPKYSLAALGIDEESVRERFAGYRERFGHLYLA